MMEIKMAMLSEIQYRHGYFKDQLCRCLSVAPAESTLREMINHGLMLKANPGGFKLLYDTRHAGSLRSRSDVLYKGIVIRLLLRLDDPGFYNYTSPSPADISKQVFYFYNRPGRAFLHNEEQVSAGDLSETIAPGKPPGKKIVLAPSRHRPFEKPFAILDFHLYPGLETNYHILFQPLSTWWNYILVGNHLKELRNPAIINTGTKENFAGPSSIRLPDERTALSFLSPAPMVLRERSPGACMLVENFDPATGKYKVVAATLPIPDSRIISGVRTRNRSANVSEILLY
jgi:hypothetical protein